MCTKGIDQWLSVNWYPPLTLDQNLINAGSTHQLTLARHLIDILVEFQFTIFHWCANQALIRCWSRSWPTVVCTECQSRCQSNFDGDIDRVLIEGQSWVLIDTWLRIPLEHMMQWYLGLWSIQCLNAKLFCADTQSPVWTQKSST